MEGLHKTLLNNKNKEIVRKLKELRIPHELFSNYVEENHNLIKSEAELANYYRNVKLLLKDTVVIPILQEIDASEQISYKSTGLKSTIQQLENAHVTGKIDNTLIDAIIKNLKALRTMGAPIMLSKQDPKMKGLISYSGVPILLLAVLDMAITVVKEIRATKDQTEQDLEEEEHDAWPNALSEQSANESKLSKLFASSPLTGTSPARAAPFDNFMLPPLDFALSRSVRNVSPAKLDEHEVPQDLNGDRAPPRAVPKAGDQYITPDVTNCLFLGDLIPYRFNKPPLLIGALMRMFRNSSPPIEITECLVFNKPNSAFAFVSFASKEMAYMVKERLQNQLVDGLSVKPMAINYRIPKIAAQAAQ